MNYLHQKLNIFFHILFVNLLVNFENILIKILKLIKIFKLILYQNYKYLNKVYVNHVVVGHKQLNNNHIKILFNHLYQQQQQQHHLLIVFYQQIIIMIKNNHQLLFEHQQWLIVFNVLLDMNLL
jgi:hypothetical protein